MVLGLMMDYVAKHGGLGCRPISFANAQIQALGAHTYILNPAVKLLQSAHISSLDEEDRG